MNNTMKKILVVAPHQDDEIIGCGGFICYAIDKKWTVEVIHVFAGTSGVLGVDSPKQCSKIRQAEAELSAKIGHYKLLDNLGFIDRDRTTDAHIQQALIKTFRDRNPHVILLPHIDESDLEHRVASLMGREASWLSRMRINTELGKPVNHEIKVLYYEIWRPIIHPFLFLNIDRYVETKKNMLKSFKSQVASSSWVQGSLGLGAYRGTTQVGSGTIEVFGADPINIKEVSL